MRFFYHFTLFFLATFVQVYSVSGQFGDGTLKKRPLLIDMLDPLYDSLIFSQSLSNLQDDTFMNTKPVMERIGRGLSKRGSGVVMPWRELCALAKQDKDCFYRTRGQQ